MRERIGDICTLKSGTTLKEDMLIEDGPIPYVKVSDMNLVGNEKYIVTANSYVDNNISEKMLFPKGTVLFPKRGGAIGTNKKRIASKSVCADLNTMGVIPSERIRPLFLYYFFKNIDFGTLYNGSSVPQINNADIAPMEIDLPSLDEQDKALAQLEKVDFLIQKRTEQLAKLDELIKARFVELFGDLKTNSKGWPVVSFKDCAEIDTNMIHDFEGYEEYPHIGIDSIEKDTGRLIGYRTIAEDGVISGKYLFSPKHIIYSKIRPNLNKVAIPDFDGLCSADAYPILVNENKCTREFFGYTLRSNYFLDYILAFSSRTNLPKVNKNQVEGFTLPLPEIGIQRQFAEFVKQVDKSKL